MDVGRRLNQDKQTFLILDNAPAHRNADNPGENMHGDRNVTSLFTLPKYC